MARFLSATCPKGQGVRPKSQPLKYLERFSATAGGAAPHYQGMSFLSPFFLLLDSFWFCESAAGGVPSVFAESVAAVLVDGAVPSVLAGSLVAASVAGGLAAVPSPVAGAAASGVVPFVESLPGAGFTSSVAAPSGGVPLVVVSPVATVATIPLFPAPVPLMLLPPVKMSVPGRSLLSGSICGVPLIAVMRTSGPEWKIPIDLCIMLTRGRGAFCSAVIHVTALGSGWGIGMPKDFSLPLASAACFESG